MKIEKLLILYLAAGLVVWGCEKQPAETSEPLQTTMPPEISEPVQTPKPREKPDELPNQAPAEAVVDPNAAVSLQFLGHAGFKISHRGTNIYIDPWNLQEALHDAALVLVSHHHRDHCSVGDIAKVSHDDTELVATMEVVKEAKKGRVIKPAETLEIAGIKVIGIPAYNLDKEFHPKDKLWLGFVIEIGGRRIYYAGDTDVIEDMKSLGRIDVALLPVGGTYTMNVAEAIMAADMIKPRLAVPYHFGANQIVENIGGLENAVQFSQNAGCMVRVMLRKEIIYLEASDSSTR